MAFLIWLAIIVIVYVVTFKQDFTKETIEKVSPFLIIVAIIVLLLGLLLGKWGVIINGSKL